MGSLGQGFLGRFVSPQEVFEFVSANNKQFDGLLDHPGMGLHSVQWRGEGAVGGRPGSELFFIGANGLRKH